MLSRLTNKNSPEYVRDTNISYKGSYPTWDTSTRIQKVLRTTWTQKQ